MGLTFGAGPLSGHPSEDVNYRLDGPAHKLLAHPFPRRIRAEFAGRTVLDSERATLLHETGLPHRYYLSPDEVRLPLLPSATRTYCPYKGEASYWTARLPDGTEVADVAWSYPDPLPESARIAGRLGFLGAEVRLLVDGRPG